jgi:hypothetical protein
MWLRWHAMQAGWSGQQMVRTVAGESRSVPSVDFVAEPTVCPECGGEVRVHNSRRRQVVTLAHGPIEVREIRKRCRENGCRPLRSAQLAQLVKPGLKYGYDLIVHVGLARYLAGLQRDEIQRVLRDDHGIELSCGSITALCDRFLSYLETLHIARAPVLREALGDGYPMYIDATCERGKGGLFVCIGGWQSRHWVLGAARVSSENGANLAPVVDKAVALFGTPVCTMRDLGDGCANAVASLRKTGVVDLVCHYHFLAAVGRALFKRRYDKLRELIRKSGCRADMRALLRDMRKYSSMDRTEGRFGSGTIRDDLKALVLWVLEGDGHADAPFPFSLPHLDFSQRCLQARHKAEPWVPRPRTAPERRALAYLERLVARLETDPHFSTTVRELEARTVAFDELREVLRLSNAELPRGDTRTTQEYLPALELLRLQQIKQAVDQYTKDIEGRIATRQKRAKNQDGTFAIILRYLRQYGPHLFGHPVKRDEEGRVVAVVGRTNNIAEHFFGSQKQQLRRRVGRGQLGRDLEKQPAQVALVANLRDPEYVRRLVGSLDQLPAAFARLDSDGLSSSPTPVRDNRDSQLQRVLRQLLEQHADPAAASEAEPSPQSELAAPTEEEITASINEMQQLSEQDIRARTTAGIAWRPEPEPAPRDLRLPPPGSVLERWYGGKAHRVEVLERGFRYRGRIYPSPGTIRRIFAETSHDGFEFFGLTMPWTETAARLRGRRINRDNMIDLPPATEF